MGLLQNQGYLFGVSYNKDYHNKDNHILGSILGSATFSGSYNVCVQGLGRRTLKLGLRVEGEGGLDSQLLNSHPIPTWVHTFTCEIQGLGWLTASKLGSCLKLRRCKPEAQCSVLPVGPGELWGPCTSKANRDLGFTELSRYVCSKIGLCRKRGMN